MSAGLFAKTKTHFIIAADGQTNYADSNDKRSHRSKIFTTPHGIGILTGDSDAFEKLHHLLSLCPEPSKIVNWPTEYDWSILYANWNGKLFDITAPGTISWPEESLYAVGCGERYIMGAAYGWLSAKKIPIDSMSPRMLEKFAVVAISAAINMDLYCGGDVELEVFPLPLSP